MKLWHERFAGWPRFEDHPIGKDRIAANFSTVSQYKLTPLSVWQYGNVVVTFNRATFTRNANSRTSRLSHIWMKTGSAWQIIGGMSADDASSPK